MTNEEREEFAVASRKMMGEVLSAWSGLLDQQRKVEAMKDHLNREECALHNQINEYAKLVQSSGLRYEKGLSRDTLYLLKRELGEEKGIPVNA